MKDIVYSIYYLKNTKEIYGYTDNKDIANEFESQRNMKLFHKKKIKLNTKEIHDLADSVYKSNIIRIYNLDTYNDEKRSKDVVFLALTEIEYMTVTQLSARFTLSDIAINAWVSYDLFKPCIRELLDVFDYNKLHDSISSDGKIIDIATDIIFKNYDGIDEFNIFLSKFGKTMIGGVGNIEG